MMTAWSSKTDRALEDVVRQCDNNSNDTKKAKACVHGEFMAVSSAWINSSNVSWQTSQSPTCQHVYPMKLPKTTGWAAVACYVPGMGCTIRTWMMVSYMCILCFRRMAAKGHCIVTCMPVSLQGWLRGAGYGGLAMVGWLQGCHNQLLWWHCLWKRWLYCWRMWLYAWQSSRKRCLSSTEPDVHTILTDRWACNIHHVYTCTNWALDRSNLFWLLTNSMW